MTVLLAGALPAASQCYHWPLRKSRGAFAYDGDTIYITMQGVPVELSRMSVRLDGVDTPEIRGKCDIEKQMARDARAFTRQWLVAHKDDMEICDPKWGKYAGRIVAHVRAGSEDLTLLLIRAGLGRAYNGDKRPGWCD